MTYIDFTSAMGSRAQEEPTMRIRISWDFRWGKKRIKGSIQIRF
jgi:hypothetical protein